MSNWKVLKEYIDAMVKENTNINFDQQLVLNNVLVKMESLEKETKASIGDKIEIIGNCNSHEFEIGQEVIVVEWNEFGDPEDVEYGVEASDGKNSWFIRHEDYEVCR